MSTLKFTRELFDALWERYRSRVSYVRDYERLIKDHDAEFVNDHVAFRTFRTTVGTYQLGMPTLAVLFRPLGFRPMNAYEFRDKHLRAVHLQHADPTLPKLFVSELDVEALPEAAQAVVSRYMLRYHSSLGEEDLQQLHGLSALASRDRNVLLTKVLTFFDTLPWGIPDRDDIETLNKHTQYGAWVLVHGYDVNHFTASVNSHGEGPLDSIEKVVQEMRGRGVPMKESIEGTSGSKLRQTATESVRIPVTVRGVDGRMQEMTWTYAYFEFAERALWRDPESGKDELFQGFLGPQANNLFDMTRVG